MSFVIQLHASPDLLRPTEPPLSLIVTLHSAASSSGLARRGASLADWSSRLFRTLRAAAGPVSGHGGPHRSRPLPRSLRLTEVQAQSAGGGSQVQSATAPVNGRAGAAMMPLNLPAQTARSNRTGSVGARDFASLYCAAHRLRPRQFVAAVFRQTLQRPGRRFAGALVRFLPWAFARDRAFLAAVGRVQSVEQYAAVEERFHRWPASPSFLCRLLGLRISPQRVRRLVARFYSGGS